jgi:2-hydroxy-3-keto-5-methylthiopentenyl-1-phosphate phosphatase
VFVRIVKRRRILIYLESQRVFAMFATKNYYGILKSLNVKDVKDNYQCMHMVYAGDVTPLFFMCKAY